ncbi:hypothetical protein BDZ91DRAFT_736568 [Kalaharituber pfeilii]|nr:hypothetical protein BDZ91DRAFT_736568 [Kalaharituber pfeilii]
MLFRPFQTVQAGPGGPDRSRPFRYTFLVFKPRQISTRRDCGHIPGYSSHHLLFFPRVFILPTYYSFKLRSRIARFYSPPIILSACVHFAQLLLFQI